MNMVTMMHHWIHKFAKRCEMFDEHIKLKENIKSYHIKHLSNITILIDTFIQSRTASSRNISKEFIRR